MIARKAKPVQALKRHGVRFPVMLN